MNSPVRTTACATLTAAALALQVSGTAALAQPDSVTMATGSTGGSWYPIGAGFAKILADNGALANAEPGGSVSNIINVSNGQFEVGFTMGALVGMAADGIDPFPEAIDNVRALAVFGESFTHVLVTEDSGIDSVAELEGERFGTFPPGSMGALAFSQVLEAAGVPEDSLTLFRGGQSYQSDQVRDRRTVGGTSTSAFPSGTWTELMTSFDMKLLPIDDELYAALQEINPGFRRTILPAGTYPGQDEDVLGVATVSLLTVSADMAEEDAYWIAKTLHENIEEIQGIHASLRDLTGEDLAAVGGVPIHPGAERYYREAGLLD